MLNEQYDHPFKMLIEYFRNQILSEWYPNEDLLIPHSVKEDALQYFMLYIVQLYHKIL